MYTLSGEKLDEAGIQDMLKKDYLVEHYNGYVYNHYSNLERNGYKVVRKIVVNNGYVFSGVFLFNINDTQLKKFEVIEKSHNTTLKQELLEGTIFYIGSGNITYMH